MPGLDGKLLDLNEDRNIPSTSSQMTLDAVHTAYLFPTLAGASPIPISTASLRNHRKPDTSESRSNLEDEQQQQQQQQQPYLLVGRQSTSSDIRISHNSISRKHALLYYDSDGNCIVQDLGSKYGTTINQHRISSRTYILHHDDQIQFGNVQDNLYTVQIYGDNNTTGTIATNERTAQEGNDMIGMILNDDTERRSNTTVPTEVSSRPKKLVVSDMLEKAGEGLSGRAKHQAEIAAMMSTLDEEPTYSKPAPDEATFPSVGNPAYADYHNGNNNNNHNPPTDAVIYTLAESYQIPISHQIVLESDRTRKNVPTCLSIDPVGARFLMGCTDTTLRMYDFGGLVTSPTLSTSNRRVVQSSSFKSIIPEDGYWPVSCAYSKTGDRIIVGTGSVQPIVTDREGETIIKFVRGDMYVTDQSKTSGHTAAVTGVDWHPFERDVVVTSSNDGSARLWNINSGKKQFQMLVCDKVFQPKSSQGKRTTILCIAFHPSGREFAVGTSCGSIQIWNPTRTGARPERAIYAAHGDKKRVTSLTYNFDGSKIATRSADDSTAKVWNATKMSSSSIALVTCNNASSIHEQANVAFSPDGKTLCVGVAAFIDLIDGTNRNQYETGGIHFYDVSSDNPSCDPILTLNLDESNVGAVLVAWHSKINQIFIACSNGQIIVYYNPTMSRKGAISTSGKVRKSVDGLTELLRSRAPTGSAAITGEIITPLYNPSVGRKRNRNEILEEVHTLEPERPVTTKHKIGSGGSSGLSFQQYVADTNVSSTSKIIAGNDPREALFKYNEGKAFVSRAYEGNESKLAEKTAEQEDEESKQKKDFFSNR